MKVKHIVRRFSLLLTLPLVSAQAATYYVSTTGSDANPGSSSQPFRTITHAYSLAGPGTTILVAPGTYTDYTSGWGLHFNANGTAASPVVLQSQVRGGAILDGQFASDRHDGIYLDGSYNVIEGFVITRAPITGVYVAGNNNQILDDEIRTNGTQGASDPEGQGIYSVENSSGNVYERNFIHDNGYAGSNLDHGLYLCGQNEVVANNVVIRQPSRGLQIAGYTTVSNMKVYNNVFAYNGANGITVWMAMNGVNLCNNICYANGRYGIEFYAATGSGVTVDHNVVYGNTEGEYSFTDASTTVSYTLGTTIASDPKLANETEASFDAHLGSSSPAVGAGYNYYSLFTTDMPGTARAASGQWDLGAYVYNASSGQTTPTVTVAATTPVASRVGLIGGAFTLSRTGSTASALTVNFTFAGTAVNGTDYSSVSASAIIPAGASSTIVPVVPLPSLSYAGAKSAVLGLSASSAYTAGSASSATVTIHGNSLATKLKFSGSAALLNWSSVAGKIYGVAYKTSLTNTAWTNFSSLVTALGTTASYNDTTASKKGNRFYVVYVTD